MPRQGLLATLLACAGIFSRLLWQPRPLLPILAHHQILDDNLLFENVPVPDPGLLRTAARAFGQQMALIARHFDTATFQSKAFSNLLADALMLITYDGMPDDNYQLIYLIPGAHGFRAVLFLAADFIGGHSQNGSTWWPNC